MENTLHARSQIRILPRSIEIMVKCKKKAKQRAITMEGQRHLGAVVGSSKYKREYDELINKKRFCR